MMRWFFRELGYCYLNLWRDSFGPMPTVKTVIARLELVATHALFVCIAVLLSIIAKTLGG